MSRSYRKPYVYICSGARPSQGKQITSRQIRRAVKVRLTVEEEAFDFCHKQDRTRGRAGSRSADWGWMYFGDGRYYHTGADAVRK